ncbi:protein FANTASTIC FOUR 1-like [Nicotiana sylvestris]|uniref:Protein FANTASTIC FOUR 1-like n=2 Tax=Nicotiana TaxID=4085 RepID=A0A1S3ZZP9_TOBAC|nr:PREDICTED: protein FANTASTIC FOUR 1-like [Nicotiana sylvestris]XP_016469922.1 PREDICTED: protein FANTASTIC FOUR 1-like [Nicotiana tabacum]
MAACGGLNHMFAENSTTLDSLSFTEIFEELDLKDNNSESSFSSSISSFSSNLPPLSAASSSLSSTSSSYNSSSFSLETIHQSGIEGKNKDPIYPTSNQEYKHSDSFSSRNSDTLSLCIEGLGFESSDDVEDIMNYLSNENEHEQEHEGIRSTCINSKLENHHEYSKRYSRTNKGSLLPPPISCIGGSGKPWVCFKSYREDGRFILKEIRIPEWEFLHACREDGRLKLQYIQSDDEILEEDEDEEEYDDDSEDFEEEPNDDDKKKEYENLAEEQ